MYTSLEAVCWPTQESALAALRSITKLNAVPADDLTHYLVPDYVQNSRTPYWYTINDAVIEWYDLDATEVESILKLAPSYEELMQQCAYNLLKARYARQTVARVLRDNWDANAYKIKRAVKTAIALLTKQESLF